MLFVYHKVKGDRLSGAEYKFLSSHSDKESAVVAAETYNTRHGYKKGGLHYAVVRKTRA